MNTIPAPAPAEKFSEILTALKNAGFLTAVNYGLAAWRGPRERRFNIGVTPDRWWRKFTVQGYWRGEEEPAGTECASLDEALSEVLALIESAN